MEKITSRNNEKIKFFQKLSASSKCRRENSLYALEGARLCFDALLSGEEVKEVFFTAKASAKFSEQVKKLCDSSRECFEITDEVAQKLAGTSSTQGIFCIMEYRQNILAIDTKLCYIALDGIQDPANLGAMARTAEALGIGGLILYNCCDVYNQKALRASMGAFFRLPVLFTDDLPKLLYNKAIEGMLTVAAVPDRDSEDICSLDFKSGAITVIGNEGNGVCEAVKNACAKKAVIPMRGRAESLNAAAAGAIVMWEMMK
jgi:TrmH family RNA methyltransferase